MTRPEQNEAQSGMWVFRVLVGAVIFGIGLFGIFDEYFAVVEFIKGFLQPAFALIGLIAILAGLLTIKPKVGQVVFGVFMLGIGIYGFFDEYYAVLDFFKGSVPLVLLALGVVAVVSGVKQLD